MGAKLGEEVGGKLLWGNKNIIKCGDVRWLYKTVVWVSFIREFYSGVITIPLTSCLTGLDY
jgi:hypothetical protein